MTEQAPPPKYPTTVKAWANIAYPGTEHKSKKYKLNLKTINRLFNWSDDTELRTPFNGYTEGGIRKQMKSTVSLKKNQKLLYPEDISYTNNLPISGKNIVVKYVAGDFKVTSNNFTFDDIDIVAKFADILPRINSLRDKDNIKLSYIQMQFLLNSTALARLYSKQLSKFKSLIEPSANKDVKFNIDRNFLRFLVSLETLNPHMIAREMYNFIDNQFNLLKNMELLFWGIGEDEGLAHKIMACKTAMNELRDALTPAASNHLDPSGSLLKKDTEGVLTPASALSKYMLAMEMNPIGERISHNVPHDSTTLSKLNYNDVALSRGGEPYNLLENWLRKLISECFVIVSSSDNALMSDWDNSIDSNTYVLDSLLKLMEFSGIKSTDYERALSRANHLDDTVTNENHKGQIASQINLIQVCLKSLKINSIDQLPALVGCLRNNPSSIEKTILEMEKKYDANATWKEEIRFFEVCINNNQSSSDESLLNITSKYDISPQKLHETLDVSLNELKEANSLQSKIMSELHSTNATNDNITKEKREKLTEAKNSLIKKYNESINSLTKRLSGNVDLGEKETKTHDPLEGFAEKVDAAVQQYLEDLKETYRDAVIQHSEAPGALMIGLGQGGEQIVRATMAKLLNNPTDTRCKNLIKALNIDQKGLNVEIKNLKCGYDLTVPTKEKDDRAKYQTLLNFFDSANILAINAGPEQETMLETTYNYIWGNTGQNDTRYTQEKDNFSKPSTNTVLLDISEEGSGGKMGIGRAYAVHAENAIQDSIRQKKEGKNIRHVCVVHSFAGGSGSGMILPVLRMIKQTLPGALVWVFSAGETKDGSSTHDSENVVYITSDVLQARYNALHYKEKEITLKEWKNYTKKAGSIYSKLNKDWADLIQYLNLDSLHSQDEFNEHKQKLFDDLERRNREATSESENQILDLSNDRKESIKNPFILAPSNPQMQTYFYKTASNVRSATEIRTIWEQYNKFKEDLGSYMLTKLIITDNNSKQSTESQSEWAKFRTQYVHLKYISMGVDHLSPKDGGVDKDFNTVREDLREEYKARKDLFKYLEFGLKVKQKWKKDSPHSIKEISKKILDYANDMRRYHALLSDMQEKVKLNLKSKDDPMIKHFIVSNAHLDVAAKDLINNRTKLYEIYNSTITDTFLNLVHSLVQNDGVQDNKELSVKVSMTNEVMDLNDMSGRTDPTSNATVLSLPEIMSSENDIYYSLDDETIIKKDTAYKIFEQLFEHPLSPIMNKQDNATNYQIPGDIIQSFYSNYLKDSNGVRRHHVWDVIDSIDKSDILGLTDLVDDRIPDYWEAMSVKYRAEWSELETKGYDMEVLKKSIHWLLMLNPELLVSRIFENTEKRMDFIKNTSDWQSAWDSVFNNTNPNSALNNKFRSTYLSNRVTSYLGSSSGDSQSRTELMTHLFESIGIIDESHLSAIPSSFIYDFAAVILSDRIKPKLWISINGKDREIPDIQVQQFFNINQGPSIASSEAKEDREWGKLRKTLGDNFRLYLKNENGGSSPIYLKVQNEKTNFYAITPAFMRDFALIKEGCADRYPEMSSTTVLNKLILATSNTTSSSNERTIDEKPRFRRAYEDLKKYSSPRRLYPDETTTALILRSILLGNKPSNTSREKVLFDSNIYSHVHADWLLSIQTGDHVYGNLFNPTTFDTELHQRVVKFGNTENISDITTTSVLLNHIKNKMSDDGEDFNCKDFFDKLFHSLKADEEFIQTIPPGIDPVTTIRHLNDVRNLLSRLAGLSFAVKRQHNFATDPDSDEYGVAFELDGSLDATRSVPTNWLWLVNSSTMIKANVLEKTIQYYAKNYLEVKQKPVYKVFVQHLQNGPLCNMTLISQKAGFTEVSQKYSHLMELLSQKRFEVIEEPCVHPYSFLRNILWIHTFKDLWVTSPTNTFESSIDIPNDVIKKVFSQPELIEITEGSIQNSGKMAGIALSQYDLEMWRMCKEVVWNNEDEDDEEHYQKRMKSQLHIPDLIFINYMKELARESGHTDIMEVWKKTEEDTDFVFPSKHWKIKYKQVGGDLSKIKIQNGADSEEEKGPAGELEFLKDILRDNDPVKKSNIWLHALTEWVNWYTKRN
jgi:hypothetical protein